MADLYKEDLPDQCPPAESQEIRANMQVFRLIETTQPKDNDFVSQRASNPDAVFGVDECIARGVSVFARQADVDNLRKMRKKFRNAKVCCVTLCNGAGKIMQTLGPNHRTWWPLAAYPILNHCEVLG